MNLLIDIGNSFSKVAVYGNQERLFFSVYKNISVKDLKEIVLSFPLLSSAILSSVAEDLDDIICYLDKKFDTFISLNYKTKLPFSIGYKTPSTLGMDRIALVAGALAVFPGNNILAIDMGTAITYDLITKGDYYKGGNISPGIDTRFKSLHDHTRKLPLLERKDDFPVLGESTEDAIISGVLTGIVFEIDGYIYSLKTKYNDLKVVLTGGDSIFFAGRLKNTIFAEYDLIFLGLNKILKYNTLTKSND